MALSATFTANFASFYDAVDKATVKLKDFGDGADKVGKRLGTLEDQFSGRKIVQEATIMAKAVEDIGGVTKLTEKELARLGATTNEAVSKMKALGMDVPANLQKIADETKNAKQASVDWLGSLTKIAGAVGIAFSVDAVVGFVGSIFTAASEVKNLAEQWGVSAEAAQRFTGAASESGIEAQTVGKSIQFLTGKLAESSREYEALLANVGLSAKTLRGMTTEDAYRAVLTAIGGIKDETLALDVAQGLLGDSSKKMIGAFKNGFLEAADAQKVWSDETVKRLADAEAAWGRLIKSVTTYSGLLIDFTLKTTDTMGQSWGAFFGTVGAYITGGTASVAAYNIQLEASAKASKKVAAGVSTVSTANTNGTKTTAEIAAATKKKEEADKKAADAAETHRKKIQELTDAISGAGLAKQVKDLSEAYAKLTPAQTQNLDVMLRLAEKAKALRDNGATLTAGLANLVDQSEELNRVLDNEAEALFLVYSAEQARIAIHAKTTVGLQTLTAKQIAANATNAAEVSQRGAQIQGTTEYNTALEHMAYLTSVAEAEQRQHTDATADATAAQEKFRTAISAVAGAFATLGNITGGGLGNVADKVGKLVGAMNVAATSTEELKKGFTSFKAGNMTQGLGQAAAGAVGLYGSFMAATEGTGKLESAMNGAALGMSVAGPWGAAVGGAIGLMKGFHNAAREHAEVRRLKMAVVDSAGGFREFQRDVENAGLSLDQFLSARSTAEYEAAMAKIDAAFQFQEDAIALAIETAERYGFTLEELGPALGRAQLDKQAQQLYKDWQILNAAGLDTVVITERMAESINKYIQDAITMGIEVPAAMRPMLETMAKQGQLTDANGNKIEDLEGSGINFAMTMSEGFERLIEKVGELTDAISRGLSRAIEDVPDIEIDAQVNWAKLEGLDAQQAGWWNRGQTGSAKPPEGYARGTDGFKNFGAGTPVVLHGWEAVVPRDNAGAFATVTGASASAGPLAAAAPINIVINAQGALFDTPGDLQRLASRVEDALSARHGLTNKRRAA